MTAIEQRPGAATAIETPCIKLCVIDPASSLCAGCGRSVTEIGGWIGMTAAERRRVMAELPERLRAIAASAS
jgi:uncharacterized protein